MSLKQIPVESQQSRGALVRDESAPTSITGHLTVNQLVVYCVYCVGLWTMDPKRLIRILDEIAL